MVNDVKSSSNSYQIPLEGIKKAEASIAERAQRISNINESSNDTLVEDMIGIKTDVYAVKANTAVIRSLSKLEDSILDILA